ncbi:MAG: hypothetical protein KGJ90_04695 [Patescibacteria group bacterium]|nr:hypothetical protein [Patescibacteria group bacterium]
MSRASSINPDAVPMKGFDPNLGLGKRGYARATRGVNPTRNSGMGFMNKPRGAASAGRTWNIGTTFAVPGKNADSTAVRGFKKGGKVKKTGIAKVHKGEVVLNKKQQKKVGNKNLKRALKKLFP